MYRREADVFAPAEGSIWRRPLMRGRADSPGSLAQGMLHRDGPGTEESSQNAKLGGGNQSLFEDRKAAGCCCVGIARILSLRL